MYRPQQIKELRTAVEVLVPTYKTYNGDTKKTYPKSGELIFVNWKSRGGTETEINGVLSIIDTAEIVTWYDPTITSSCRIKRSSGEVYEILGEPENVELQNQYLTFKVERVKGGA